MATVILMVMMVAVFKVPDEVGIIMLCSFFISGLSILIINFNKKNRFYKPFLSSLEKLDRKFLITETLKEEPITYEEKIVVESLHEINRSMLEKIRSNYPNKRSTKDNKK